MRRSTSRVGLTRKHRQQRYAVRAWSNKMKGVPAFILGTAPSIIEQNISLLKNYFTIGINRIFREPVSFDPTILMWQDISLWKTDYVTVHNLQALKVARDCADPKRAYYNFYLKGGSFKFDPSTPHILYGGGSSGVLAAEFAVALGCEPLILLGMDCKVQGDNSDFYGPNKFWGVNTLNYCRQGLEFLKKECPVEIVNCGNSDLWPKKSLPDVIKAIDPRWAMGRQEYVRLLTT